MRHGNVQGTDTIALDLHAFHDSNQHANVSRARRSSMLLLESLDRISGHSYIRDISASHSDQSRKLPCVVRINQLVTIRCR